MRILFIYPEMRTDIPNFTGYYAEGPAILSSVLKAHGHETDLLHITRFLDRRRFQEALRRRPFDVVGFSSLSPVFNEVKRLAPLVKEVRDVPVLCGGVHPTLDPEGAIRVDGIDILCRGEGEEALVELLARMESGRPFHDVRNLWVKENGLVTRNPCRELIEDLDRLPLPDFGLFDLPNLFSAREGVATMTASRGCPYHCSYCSNHKVRTLYANAGNYVRFKSVDRTLQEALRQLSLCDRLKRIDFSDDIFILKKDWLESFAARYPAEVGRPFICNALVNLVDEESAALLRRAGCTMVTIGLESGSERLRREILQRPAMTNERILQAAQILRKNQIKLATYNMVGLPTETVDEVFDTIRLNALLRPVKINEFIFQPYPNTDIYERCVKENLYDPDRPLPNNWRNTTVLVQPQLPEWQVVFLHRYFKVLVGLLSLCGTHAPGKEDAVIAFVRERILKRKWLAHLSNQAHYAAFTALKLLYVKVLSGFVNRRGKEFSSE